MTFKEQQPPLTVEDQIDMLIDKYSSVKIGTMGFPENWKSLLIDNKNQPDAE